MLTDITRPLVEGIEVYPGDEPFIRGWTCLVADGAAANVSWVRGTSHAGTHVDFPSHLIDGAPEPRLEAFMGVCFVCDRSLSLLGPRVLIKGIGPLTSADVDALLDVECELVGIEGMSVDALDSEDLPNHKRLLGAGVVILENLDLSGVSSGIYNLIALPLKIPGAEATWVRAVLSTA